MALPLLCGESWIENSSSDTFKSMRKFNRLTFPLRATLVTAVTISAALAIALTIAFMGLPLYLKAKNSIRGLWEDLAKQVSLTATEEILDYFQNAPVALSVIEGFVGLGQLNSKETVLNICYQTLVKTPQFVSIYYAQNDGSFTGVFKIGNDFLGSYRAIQANGKTLVENYHLGPDRRWVLSNEEIGDYDPRKRPFWQTGTAHPNGAWTEPYTFATTKAKGYSYVLGQKVNQAITGYWTIDFQIDNLDQYLQSLAVGKEGSVFIVSNDGTKIAESGAQITLNNQDNLSNLINANKASGFLKLNHLIVYTNRFPKESMIPWSVITVIREGDFLHPIRDSSLRALGYGLLPCLLFLLITAVLFGNMSSRLREIAFEMSEAGDLTFHSAKQKAAFSRIREINMMNNSLQKMTIGLHSFSKYVPFDLIKKLIHSGLSPMLGGEKKEISILFADLAQFTTLSEKLNPTEVVKILEAFLEIVTTEVHKEKGIIDKFMGDAAMALFGAPDPIVNHPLAACRTALAMKEISALDPLMKYRIGINSGFAMVGNFGSQERMDYTAIGDTVNIAARLEKLNKLYNTQILIGPTTAKTVKEVLLVRPIDWVVLQGKTQSILIYELINFKENIQESLKQAISIYHHGLESYRKRQFAEARGIFERANFQLGGDDTPCKLLIERCKFFEKNPPPSEWDGTAIHD